MPYLPSSARQKSEYYQKILDADIIEQESLFRDLKLKQGVSGSSDAISPLRDDDGNLISIESPRQEGQSINDEFDVIRLENRQQYFDDKNLSKIDNQFTYFVPPPELDKPEEEKEKEIIKVEIKREEKKAKPDLHLKKAMVRFINRALRVNYPLNMSTNLLNSKILEVIKKFVNPKRKMVGSTFLASYLTRQKKNKVSLNQFMVPIILPKFKFMFGSLLALTRLKGYIKNLQYQKIYDEFIFTNKELIKFWGQANENAPREEFDMFSVSGLEDTVEVK
jgi:hypothetical protein